MEEANGVIEEVEDVRESLYGFRIRERDKRESAPGTRRHEIKKLWSRSHEIINLDSLGYRHSEIAKMLDIKPQTVSNTLNSQLGREVCAEVRKTRDEEYETLRDDALELTKKAMKVYHEIFDEPDVTGRVPLKMKKETADTVVLELSGLRAPTQIQSQSMNMTLTPEDIEAFKQRGIAAAKAAGNLIEVKGEGERK